MTLKVDGVLRKINAIKNYLEENSEALNNYQAIALDAALEEVWSIACRRKGMGKRPEEERRLK